MSFSTYRLTDVAVSTMPPKDGVAVVAAATIWYRHHPA